MTQKQMNRKQMVEATITYMDQNLNEWQSIPKIAEVKTKLSEICEAIEAAAAEQNSAMVFPGKIKAMVKKSLADKADIVNDVVEVYALMNNQEVLAQQMSDSANELLKLKNETLIIRVKQIIDAATENQAALLADYGLSAELISDLQADYDRFLELNGQPRVYRVKSAVATLNLEELFTQASNLLSNQLDNLMKVFKRRNANFYNGYLKARVVVDY